MNGIFFITKLITIDIDILLLDYHRVTAIPWLKKKSLQIEKVVRIISIFTPNSLLWTSQPTRNGNLFFATAIAKNGERNGERVFFFYSGAAELDEIADAGPSVGGTADPGAQLLAQPLVRHADHLDDHQVPPGQQSAPSVIDSAESQPERN